MQKPQKAYVTVMLVVINLIVFGLEQIVGYDYCFEHFGMYRGALTEDIVRMITSGFVHYGTLHLSCNMIALIYYGSRVEMNIGSLETAIVYLISLLGGSLFVNFLGVQGFHAGASSAIWGLLMSYLWLRISYTDDWSDLIICVYYLALDCFYNTLPGISWQGHLGGGVAGLLTTMVILTSARKNVKIQPRVCPSCNRLCLSRLDHCMFCPKEIAHRKIPVPRPHSIATYRKMPFFMKWVRSNPVRIVRKRHKKWPFCLRRRQIIKLDLATEKRTAMQVNDKAIIHYPDGYDEDGKKGVLVHCWHQSGALVARPLKHNSFSLPMIGAIQNGRARINPGSV